MLPEGYFAELNAQFGIEIDVATFSKKIRVHSTRQAEISRWAPEAPTATLPFQPTTDVVEVQVFSTEAEPALVGAIIASRLDVSVTAEICLKLRSRMRFSSSIA